MSWEPSDELVEKCEAVKPLTPNDTKYRDKARITAYLQAAVESGELVPRSELFQTYNPRELEAARAAVAAARELFDEADHDEVTISTKYDMEQALDNYDAITNDTEQP